MARPEREKGNAAAAAEGEGIMSISVLRAMGRLLLPVTAAVLLAGVSVEADAYGSRGRIAFETGKVLDGFHFTLEEEHGDQNWYAVAGPVRQGFYVLKGCTIAPKSALSEAPDPELVSVMAYRGTSAGTLGYVSTSLGVYDGPQGTACGRVSESKNEVLSLAVGSATELGDANAFDRLELDIEVKGDVVLELEISFDGPTRTYTLRAGSLVADPSPEGFESDPNNLEFRCRAASDSGPDSGPSDNCRWIINDVGRSFKIKPKLGEFSLEGGADYSGTEAALNRTFIFLTRADGILDCGDQIETGDATAGIACEVTRLDNANCVPVPYVFRTDIADDGTQTCVLETDMGTQQLIANIFASYGAEEQEGGDPKLLEEWDPSPLSRVIFNNSPIDYPIPPCLGLTLTNIDLASDPRIGPDPILEINQTYDRVHDAVDDDNDTIEFACAFMRREVFETDMQGNDWTRVEEGIQFWGDPSFSRPGISSN